MKRMKPADVNIDERLAQYGVTAKGQLGEGRSMIEFAGYTAAAGVGLALAGNADATVIYSGVQNVSVSLDPTMATMTTSSYFNTNVQSLSINGDTFGIGVLFAGFRNEGASSGLYVGIGALFADGDQAFMRTGGTGGYKYAASNLPASASIGPGGIFDTSAAGRFLYRFAATDGGGTPYTYNSAFGNFVSGASGFVGVQFGNGDYGWIRLRLDDTDLNQPFSDPLQDGSGFPDMVTLVDWAWEDSGAPIHVGDVGDTTSVSEPSSLALLAAGAMGLAAFRRRKGMRPTA